MKQPIKGIKVFSATKARDRECLGERVTKWISENKMKLDLDQVTVKQSSDSEFHCISITVMW